MSNYLNSLKMKTKVISKGCKTILFILFFVPYLLLAQTYPFPLPEIVTASLNVDTTVKVPANNLLLGANFGGFTSSNEKQLVRYLNPITVRFPSGVWSNWYDWYIDRSTYKMDDGTGNWVPYDNYDIGATHTNAMDTWERNDTKTGFPGLKMLHDELGFNMVWTYNLNYDSNEKSVARMLDSDAKGFDVKYIELGNEQFWKDQRSERISTPEKYYPIANSLSGALKAAKPTVELSVPLGWRVSQASYNSALTPTKSYFDAISLHRYVHWEKEEAVKTADTYKKILTSRFEIENSKNFVLSYASGKSIWLTEWGVSCGLNAASFLGQADAYLYLFEKQDTFERAEWYGATTALNPMYYFTNQYLDGGGRPERSLRNLRKTGFGAVYEILRSVFENSELLKSDMVCNAPLVAPDDVEYSGTQPSTVDAISARAVTKNGQTQVFILNRTPKAVVFDLKFNNVVFAGSFKHEALSFDSLSDNPDFANDQNPLSLIKSGTGTITLPPYSVSKVSDIFLDPTVKIIPGTIEVEDYKAGGQGVGFSDTDTIDTLGSGNGTDGVDVGIFNGSKYVGDTQNGEWLKYSVNVLHGGDYDFRFLYSAVSSGSLVSIDIDGVNLFNNLSLPQTLGTTDFKTITKSKVILTSGVHELMINVQSGGFNLDKISIEDYGLKPFIGIVAIPGAIQIEDYALGGQGVAYSDSSLGNDTSGYRTETDVDLAVGGTGYVSTALVGGEYTRYPVYVTQAGSYHMVVNYKTSSTTSKPFAAALLPPDLSTSSQLFLDAGGSTTSGIVKQVDGSGAAAYGDYISTNFNLPAGNWVIELQIPSGGAGPNYDYVTLVREGNLGVKSFNKNSNDTKVFPVPSKDGYFNLSKSNSWKVYTTLGSEILSGEGVNLDLSSFSKGMYFLKINEEKIIKLIYQ